MNYAILRRFSALALLAAMVAAVPAYAKRRAVAHRTRPAIFTSNVSGIVRDAVTNQAVIAVTVTSGTRIDNTDNQGRFELKNASGEGSLLVEFNRSGYQYHSVRIGPGNPTELTILLTPTPTTTLRRTNGEVLQLDTESLKFGYPVPFLGYIEEEIEDFCKITDSTKIRINRSQMAKLNGPAQIVPAGACCTGNAEKMTLTLKNGEVMEVIFTDTCQERYRVDVGAREHLTGQFVHIVIRDIAEMVFP